MQRVDVNIRTIFSKSCFFLKRGQRRPTLFFVKRRECDVPEDIVVDWSLRYPRSQTAASRKQFSVWTILLCIAVCVCSGVHILYRGQ